MGEMEYKLSESIAIFRTARINNIDTKYVKSSEFSVLIMINNSVTNISAIDICKSLNFSKVYASKVINNLINNNLVIKEKNNKDNRQFYLYTTDKGKEIVKKYMDKYMETTAYLYTRLGKEKVKVFIELLQESTLILKEYQKNKL